MKTCLLKLRNRHFLVLDGVIFMLAPLSAFLLWQNSLSLPNLIMKSVLAYAVLALFLRIAVYYRLGLYQRYWVYASAEEMWGIGLAALLSTAVVVLLFWLVAGWQPLVLNPAVVVIDLLLVIALTGATRFGVRLTRHRQVPAQKSRQVLIFGAGHAGVMVARDMMESPQLGHAPVAFLDDDEEKHNMHILGLPVLGGQEHLEMVVRSWQISCVIVAIPSASGSIIRQITNLCDQAQVEMKILPGMAEILNGQVTINQIRDVAIEDLLRREPVHTDVQAVRQTLAGKRVLVTGGGGSIGRELCRQILYCRPQELILLGHGENSVFEACSQLRQAGLGDTRLTSAIADVRFPGRLREVFSQTRPQILFHAAAHKHVPLMEDSPAEAVTNNVIGSQILLDAALEYDVDRLVLISTDKAVNPTSVMGASKRVAELLVQAVANESNRPYVTVRFGNVLGSRGSVVHTFKRQITAGGPVTVTDPGMKRYFMTIPEAVQLVLQAAVLGHGGEVFVLDMGKPVRIVDLARDMIRLVGCKPEEDIAIEYVGLRPGEKLFEELFTDGEKYERTEHEKIFVAGTSLNPEPVEVQYHLDELQTAVRRNDQMAIIYRLQMLVPSYRPEIPCSIPPAEIHPTMIYQRA
jgi:FlaA1/EpsC-like NDP-sugar epimerase